METYSLLLKLHERNFKIPNQIKWIAEIMNFTGGIPLSGMIKSVDSFYSVMEILRETYAAPSM